MAIQETEKVQEQNKIEAKTEMKKEEINKTEKKETKKDEKSKTPKVKKEYAMVYGNNLRMSTKEAADICSMIRGKNIDKAIGMVEEVISFKRCVRMNRREASHQHGKEVMAGGFPVDACKDFLVLLKGLRANALYHELELEKVIIFCKADQASRPYRRGGRRFKRSNVLIKLIKNAKNESKNQNTKINKQKGEK